MCSSFIPPRGGARLAAEYGFDGRFDRLGDAEGHEMIAVSQLDMLRLALTPISHPDELEASETLGAQHVSNVDIAW